MLRKKRVYVGVYSSARETSVRVEDENCNFISHAVLQDPINICISVKHSWKIIKNSIDIALRKANIPLNDSGIDIHVGLGIKNTELVESCIELKKQNNLFKQFVLAADGYVLLRGSHNNGDGAIIILDDGVVGNAVKSDNMFKVGGWGFPHADVGSIPWIGLEAIKLTIQWLDGFVEESPLLVAIHQHFNNNISNLVEWAMYSRMNPKEYNSICDSVLDFLAQKDKHSTSLLSAAAFEASKLYEKLLEKSGATSMRCSLHGQLVPHIKTFINGILFQNMTEPLGDGTHGAISLVRNSIDDKQQDNFIAPLKYRANSKYTFTG